MTDKPSDLMVGEVIEIKYRVFRFASGGDASEFADRWITAEIIHQDDDSPPLARLADGQLTDIRSFMVWRRIPGLGADLTQRAQG